MSQRRSPVGSDTLERTRYFSRQVVTPPDLAQDREYLLHRHRRHNRLFHGWGVLLGMKIDLVPPKPVTPTDTATEAERAAYAALDARYKAFALTYGDLDGIDAATGTWVGVTAGYGVTPGGDEVYLPTAVLVNTKEELNQALVTRPADCRTRLTPRALTRSGVFYLVVEATESEARPVRAAGTRCGDHPDQFESSRLRDGVCFRLVTTLPDPPYTAGGPERLTGCVRPDSDVLVLAKVTITDGKIVPPVSLDAPPRSKWTEAPKAELATSTQ